MQLCFLYCDIPIHDKARKCSIVFVHVFGKVKLDLPTKDLGGVGLRATGLEGTRTAPLGSSSSNPFADP